MKTKLSTALAYSYKHLHYQITTKLLLAVVLFPIFSFITNTLLKTAGRSGITSSDYLSFIFSFEGALLGVIGFVFLVFIIGFDINAFIIMSALFDEGHERLRTRDILCLSFKSSKNYFNLGGVFITLFIALIIPLLNININIAPFNQLEIPNFITSVIFSTPLYLLIYVVAIILLTLIFFMSIFSIHFMILNKDNDIVGIKKSFQMMKKYYKDFLKEFILFNIKISLTMAAILAITFGLRFLTLATTTDGEFLSRFLLFFILFTNGVLIGLFPLVTLPLEVAKITELFYKYQALDGVKRINISEQFNMQKLDTKKSHTKALMITSLTLFILLNAGLSALIASFFDEIFRQDIKMALVTHRTGGNMDAENSLEGVIKAIEQGTEFIEFDVQRSKDGVYIINHDPSFKRVTGTDKKPKDMTLTEIEKLRINNAFDPSMPARKVPTLEQVMDTSKDKIGLFIELKGETADKQMVDDVVEMIKAKQMEEQSVILSLDYDIIEYTENTYPDIQTGFLYFFAIGDITKLKGDYLVMEEAEATEEKVSAVQSVGKKAIVWTVNTDESIQNFIISNVDGIITDDLPKVKEAIAAQKTKSDIELIFSYFLQ